MQEDALVQIKVIRNAESMLQYGAQLGSCCQTNGIVIFLHGRLGAGKTTLTRGFLRGLGYQGHVKSPTYTLVESYKVAGFELYHFDFYRIKVAEELNFMGIEDYFSVGAICLIEWPEHCAELLPRADLSCYIEPAAQGRLVKVVADTPRGYNILQQLIGQHAQ